MRVMKQAGALTCLMLAAGWTMGQAGAEEERAGGLVLSPVQIFADEGVTGVPGSASVVEDLVIERRRPATTLDTLQTLPGVNVVSEDPLGRRPNIGIRGLNPRRSRKMTLMEDGAPIQLAPYSDSSANYQPAPRRLRRVEAVKGSGTIKYGPQTIGGSINYLTRNPPREPEVVLYGAAGNRGFIDTNISAGGTYGNTGLLVDFIHQQQDGFRRGEQQQINDFMFKSVTELEPGHRLTFKATTYNENQRGGEAGYTEEQFSNARRENPLPQDRFEVERIAGQIIHEYDFSNRTSLATNLYANQTERTSRRQASSSDKLLNCPDGVDETNFENASQCGNQIRPRDFRVLGIEPRLTHEYNALGYDQRVVVGFRYHDERAERRQFWSDSPGGEGRQCGKLGGSNAENDCRDQRFNVTATSGFIQNTTQIGDFSITPGARFERWELDESDERRGNPRETESRRFNEFLPGIGISYGGFETFELFGGVHRGISPATTDVEPEPEIGNIFEVGIRTTSAAPVTGEIALFYIDYRDLIASDRVAGDVDNANVGRARMRGIEFSGRVDSWAFFDTDWNAYLLVNGTILDTEFKDTFADAEGTVNVSRGDEFPFAPRLSGYLAVGYEVGRFDARIGAQHVGRQFVDNENSTSRSADGSTGRVASFTILDASVNYQATDNVMLFVAGRNLANREYVANRVGGITPGVRRQIYSGFEARF